MTVLVDEQVLDTLQAIARDRGVGLAQVTRQALGGYVTRHKGKRGPLTFVGIGRSGRRDVADRFEELLAGRSGAPSAFWRKNRSTAPSARRGAGGC